jgi:hypothetical protein
MSQIPLEKINHASSTQNLFRNLGREDRIALQSQPLSNNYTGSAKGLVGTLTPIHFQSFDMTRDTHVTLAQSENCIDNCMQNCTQQYPNFQQQCESICVNVCVDNTTKDFI